jgi:hypothetical protein
VTDLTEEQARQMDAGEELDRLIAVEFMGWRKTPEYDQIDLNQYPWNLPTASATLYRTDLPKYSTDWSAAGPLLEAMSAKCDTAYPEAWRTVPTNHVMYNERISATGDDVPHAAARLCAVLVARGITREEVEGE